MYSKIAPSVLQTQLDTCWINVSGEDPVRYLEKYAHRIPTVHMRDLIGRKNLVPFAASYTEPSRRAELEADFEDMPLGLGLQQMREVVKASVKNGAEWLIVENGPCSKYSCLESAKISFEFLKNITNEL